MTPAKPADKILELIALAERCEAATGPDREMDCRIYAAIEKLPWDMSISVVPNLGEWQAPYFTASLDAAMTLVPEGEGFELLTMHGKPTAFVSAGAAIDWCDGNTVTAATPALALCAAALRALATPVSDSREDLAPGTCSQATPQARSGLGPAGVDQGEGCTCFAREPDECACGGMDDD